MADDKVYFPETIDDTPFPGQTQEADTAAAGGETGEIYSAQKIPDTPFPKKTIAQETIGTSLNTKSRRILAEYQFTESGALQIGKHVAGESGDLKISPSGIVARNQDGETTFAIDGETGNATFKGVVQAGDFQVIDEFGLVSLTNFENGYVEEDSNQDTTSTDYVDVTNLTLTFDLPRAANVLFACTLQGLNTAAESGAFVAATLDLDGVDIGPKLVLGGAPFNDGFDSGVNPVSASSFVIKNVTPGTHTIKVKYKAVLGGTARLPPYVRTLAYVVLGK